MKKILFACALNLTIMIPSFAVEPGKYVNFSGDWKGSCDMDPSETFTMKIQQDGDGSVLLLNDDKYHINAITSEEHQLPNFTDKNLRHFHWTDDGQQLIGTSVSMVKPGFLTQGGLSTIITSMNFSLRDEKLIISNLSVMYIDGKMDGKPSATVCTYNKG